MTTECNTFRMRTLVGRARARITRDAPPLRDLHTSAAKTIGVVKAKKKKLADQSNPFHSIADAGSVRDNWDSTGGRRGRATQLTSRATTHRGEVSPRVAGTSLKPAQPATNSGRRRLPVMSVTDMLPLHRLLLVLYRSDD